MASYLMMLYVSLEQEVAVKDLFADNGWGFKKLDLRKITEDVGPLMQEAVNSSFEQLHPEKSPEENVQSKCATGSSQYMSVSSSLAYNPPNLSEPKVQTEKQATTTGVTSESLEIFKETQLILASADDNGSQIDTSNDFIKVKVEHESDGDNIDDYNDNQVREEEHINSDRIGEDTEELNVETGKVIAKIDDSGEVSLGPSGDVSHSTAKKRKLSSKEKSMKRAFCWEIEHIAELNPVDISVDDIPKQYLYVIPEPEKEERAQRAIEKFFTSNIIPPSPGIDSKERKTSVIDTPSSQTITGLHRKADKHEENEDTKPELHVNQTEFIAQHSSNIPEANGNDGTRSQEDQNIVDDQLCSGESVKEEDYVETEDDFTSVGLRRKADTSEDTEDRKSQLHIDQIEEYAQWPSNEPDNTQANGDDTTWTQTDQNVECKESCSNDSKNIDSDAESQHYFTAGVKIDAATAYKVDGRRNIDKKHCCVFCGKLDFRLPRHYERKHKNNPLVIALDTMSGKKREKEFERLRLEGDYNHNIKVLMENKGTLILPRRPSTKDYMKYSFDDYLACKYCKAFRLKNNLLRHQQTCEFRPEPGTSTGNRGRPQRDAALLMESFAFKSKQLNLSYIKNVVASLHVDEISNIVKKDDIILRLGNFMYDKQSSSQRDNIIKIIRLLGRLVLSLRTVLGLSNGLLKDFLSPKNFDGIVKAAKLLAEQEETGDTNEFKKTPVARKCGHLLEKCCIILKDIARTESNEKGEKEAERLQKLIADKWFYRVTPVTLRSRTQQRKNEQVLLPTPQDLMKFNAYIEKQIKVKYKELQENSESTENFQELQTTVLCRLIMFNRSPSGETSKILMADYLNRPDLNDNINSEIYENMSTLERKLITRLNMIALSGVTGKQVSVILTPDVKTALDLLVKCRGKILKDENPYLFPSASGGQHIRGRDAVRQLAFKAELQYPGRIGSTYMRKYTATVAQMLNLNKSELEWLSNHLGQSILVNKEIDRTQETAIQLGKIAKTLLALDNGQSLTGLEHKDIPDAVIASDGESEEEEVEEEEEEEEDMEEGFPSLSCYLCPTQDSPETPSVERRQRKVYIKRPWTENENRAVKRHLQCYINIEKVPGKAACSEVLEKEQDLRTRDWKAIKYFIKNQICSKNKGKKPNSNSVHS